LAIERLMRWYSAASAVLHLPDDPRVPWRGARDSTAGDLSMRRAIVALAGAVIMVASPAAEAADKGTIGFLSTMSGPSAARGLDQLAGFKLAMQQRDGKLGGIATELLTADDELKPDLAIQLAKKFVEASRADIVVGTTFSNVLMAVAKPVTQAGVFLI